MTNMLWVDSTPNNLNTNALSAGANLAKASAQPKNNLTPAYTIGGEAGSGFYPSGLEYNSDYGAGPGDSVGNGGDPNNGAMDVADMSPAAMAVGAQQAGIASVGLPGMLGLMARGTQMGLEMSLEEAIQSINDETPFSLDIDAVSAEAQAVASGNDVATGIDAAVNNPETAGQAPTSGLSDNVETGGGGDTGDGDSVICTELHRRGLMSDEMYAADGLFLRTVEPSVVAGYHMWAKPLVRLMRKSDLFTGFINLFAKHWAEHMAFSVGEIEKDNRFGKFLNEAGQPLCRTISKLYQPVKALS